MPETVTRTLLDVDPKHVDAGTALGQAMSTVVDSPAAMFERLAKDPNVDVEKLERLIAMQERINRINAEAAFNEAMSDAQKAMRPVAADAHNSQTHSRYASYEALDKALRPIYTDHGFALSFNTGDAPLPEYVRVLCDVTHRGGFCRTYRADMPADGKGAKGGDVMTKTHAVGSAMSYGMRYLLKMIFNVAVGEDDDDGNCASAKEKKDEPKAPEGYDAWLAALEGVTAEGIKAFDKAFGDSKEAFRMFLARTAPKHLAALKNKARSVKA